MHDGADLIAAHVLRDQLRTGEIGSGLSTAGIPAMTECAVLKKQRLAALDLRRRKHLSGRFGVLADDTRSFDGRLLALTCADDR